MQQYVIKRSDGKYVARPGMQHSYCSSILDARVFYTYSDAVADKCENETVVSVASEFGQS